MDDDADEDIENSGVQIDVDDKNFWQANVESEVYDDDEWDAVGCELENYKWG